MTIASIQSSPGIIQLANALAEGMSAESVAYAKMGQALDTYGNHMNTYAQDQNAQGQNMIAVTKVLTTIQWVTAILAVATVGIGGAASVAATGLSTSTAAVVSTAVNGISQGAQAAVAAVQGGMQAYKSMLQGKTEIDSTAIATFGKASDTDSNAIKNESQGVGKLGSAINTMLINEGAIARQKITH